LVNKVSESELEIFLKSYLDKLILPKIIGLSGPLGAGKTTIAKEIIKYFGSTEVVTSPTFNIVKQYSVEIYKFIILIYIVWEAGLSFLTWTYHLIVIIVYL